MTLPGLHLYVLPKVAYVVGWSRTEGPGVLSGNRMQRLTYLRITGPGF